MAVDGTVLESGAAQAAARIVEVLRERRKNTHASAQTELKEKLTELAARHQELATQAAAIREQVAESESRQRNLAAGQADADAKITAMEARLAAGEGMTSRDLLALQGDIDTARTKRAELEDDELEVIDEVEGLQARLESLQAEAAQVAADGQAAQQERKDAAAQFESQAAALDGELRENLERLPPPVAEAITGDLSAGGNGLAQVSGGACGACGESLAGDALSTFNAAQPGTVFTCEACEVPLLKAV